MKKHDPSHSDPPRRSKSIRVKRIRDIERASLIGKHPSLETPSTDSLARIESIPLLFAKTGSGTLRNGKLAQDSWAHQPIGLRDVTDGHVRRLQFRAGRIQFELVAERRAQRWEFIGRVYTGEMVAHDFVLHIGSRRLLPNSGGFFYWSSEKVTRRLRLVSLRKTVAFEDIVW